MSLPPELVRKIKLLEITARKRVNSTLLGEYHSAFKGQGMTFSEFREYIPGDDVRTIAWPLAARTGKVYIKKYDEEREMTVVLAVDVSGSQDFGSNGYLKGELSAHVAALLSFAATGNKDMVGLLLFSDQVELWIPPRKGRAQVTRIIRELYYYQPKSRRTDLGVATEFLLGVCKKKAHVFVVSDFLSREFEHALKRLGRKHDVAAIMLEDKLESEVPRLGLCDLEDAETGEIVTVDTDSIQFREEYARYTTELRERRRGELRRAECDLVTVRTDDDPVNPLLEFFRRRRRA